jgi:carbon monoxide dehydrogenase subunit G
MGRIEKSIEIKASPDKVWEMLAFDRHPEWNEQYKSVEYTSKVRTPKDKYRVGASCRMTTKEGVVDLEITESLENEKITYRVQGMKGVRNINGTFTLKPTELGTKITAVSDYELSSLMLKMLSKLVSKALEKDFEKSLEKLKSVLEK